MKVTNAAPTRFLHLGIRRLDHEVLVHRLVEQSIGLVVHSMHWIMHDVVEGQERPAAQLLRHVLLRVTVLLPRTVLVLQGEELLVDRIEGCLAPMVGAELGGAARALEVPVRGLLLAERLPGCAVRPMAQIGERRAAIVRLRALSEVVQGGTIGLVAALAEGRAESVGVV